MDGCVKMTGDRAKNGNVYGRIVSESFISGAVISGAISRTGGLLPEYEGPYSVTPRVSSQTLPTADRSMVRDLEVLGIPIRETTNPSGGKTLYIASDEEMEMI